MKLTAVKDGILMTEDVSLCTPEQQALCNRAEGNCKGKNRWRLILTKRNAQRIYTILQSRFRVTWWTDISGD